MARILDKDTRLIDVDFGSIATFTIREEGEQFPLLDTTVSGTGIEQLLRFETTGLYAGSFIQFQRLDLDFMTMNNEVMQPVEVSVQRTNSTPYGGTHENGNNADTIKEIILITSRPLNNESLENSAISLDFWNSVGLNRGSTAFGGLNAGGITHEQNIYAERRTYAWSNTTGATQTNGELIVDPTLNTYFESPQLLDVNTWGSLSAITGPNLYCYRVVILRSQSFPNVFFTNVGYGGITTMTHVPVNVAFYCKDPKYTEGEYLTRLANAMNSIPEGGLTNEN